MTNLQLHSNFQLFLKEQKLLHAGQSVLLAVSGGVDSVVMCDLFSKSQISFGIIHCNFQLRGSDSDEDVLFVQQLAEKYQVPFFTEAFDTIQYQKENKLSLEVAARDLRYSYFEKIRVEFAYDKIATAHHVNDSIETILLNLVKGTGIRGITGIPVQNGKVIRPLLFTTRSIIENYAAENDLSYRTDASNFSNAFDRNKIRQEVIPVLRSINAGLEKTMLRNIHHFQDLELIFREQLDKKFKKNVRIKGKDIYFPVSVLQHLPAAKTYLFEWLRPYHFNEDQITQILQCLGETGKIFYSDAWRIIVDRKNLILSSADPAENNIVIINADDRTIHSADHKLLLEYSNYNKNMQFTSSGEIAYFDADLVQFPLMLRNWQAGDYLYPLGLTKRKSDKRGKKKVSDILTDAKYNILQKEKIKVLLSGDKIIWVAGMRQDDRFKITDKTIRLLKIKMLPT